MGVHSSEEINEFGQSDLKVLSDMLADKPFFFGDDPTTVSLNLFSKNFTSNIFPKNTYTNTIFIDTLILK